LSKRAITMLMRAVLAFCIIALSLPRAVAAQGSVSVDSLMAMMTVDDRVGQLFMVDFPGMDTTDESSIAQLIVEYRIGGVLISESRGNINNQAEEPLPLQVARLTNNLQQLAFRANSRTVDGNEVFIPLYLAVEQEGNGYPHTELRSGFTPVLSSMAIGASWSEENAQTMGEIVGRELAAVGVNMLLGPVLDVSDSPRSGERGDLGVRVFGGNPDWVGRLGRAYVRGVHQGSGGKVATVSKHFPGLGTDGRDPQAEVTTINRTLEELMALDLVPYAAVARYTPNDPLGTTDAFMVGHARCEALSESAASTANPLTLNEEGLQAAMALPEFAAWRANGLLVADMLGADAIKRFYNAPPADFPGERIAREALLAGNDILPLVNFSLGEDWEAEDLQNIIDTIEYFKGRYNEESEFRQRVDESVRRILQAKIALYPNLTLNDVLVAEQEAVTSVGSATDSVRAMGVEALTLLHPVGDGAGTTLPSPPTQEDDVLVLECFEGCYESPVLSGGGVQSALVVLYGADGTGQVSAERVSTLSFAQIHEWIEGTLDEEDTALVEGRIQEAEWIIVALPDYNPDEFPASRAVRELLAEREYYLADKTIVAIAYDAPYHLDSTEVSKLTAYYAVYGRAGPSVDVSLRPLFQPDFATLGISPVSIEAIGYQLANALVPTPDQSLTLERLSPPETADLYVGGEPLVVRTSVIVDHNAHPVPDGTKVEFRGAYLEGDVFVEPQVVTDTVNGVASASFWLAAPAPAGLMTVSATSGEVTSEPLSVRVVVPVTPLPTFTPTATATPSPTPTATRYVPPPTPTAEPTPTPEPVAEPVGRPVDWLDFLLACVGTVLGNAAGAQMRRGRRKGWEREVQLILYGVGLGLVGYLLFGLGLFNPAILLGWEGPPVRVFLLLLVLVLGLLPSVLVWLRGP
jgi:beta-N-acetylhexosaminidase